jgi:hypothetical protein
MTLPDDYFSVTANFGGYGSGWDHHYIHECPTCLVIHEKKRYDAVLCEACTPSQ